MSRRSQRHRTHLRRGTSASPRLRPRLTGGPRLRPPGAAVPSGAQASPRLRTKKHAALIQKKNELCGQVTSARADLSEPQAIAALEEAGIDRAVAMQHMDAVRTACGK